MSTQHLRTQSTRESQQSDRLILLRIGRRLAGYDLLDDASEPVDDDALEPVDVLHGEPGNAEIVERLAQPGEARQRRQRLQPLDPPQERNWIAREVQQQYPTTWP